MIKPTGTCVLIEVEPVEEKSSGGIVIASKSELKREFGGRDIGRVLAFGPYCYKDFGLTPEGWGVKVGDLVEFNRYDGKIPRLAEKDEKYKNYRLITDNDILAVYE
jgi:co-chaperonin GroES (HSP10)